MIQPSMDYMPRVSVNDRAKQIRDAALEVVNEYNPSANSLLKERMVVQGLYDWTRTHITYNLWLGNQKNDRDVRKHYWNAEELFTFKKLTAVCAGIADVMAKMTASLGIKATKVDGFGRGSSFDSTRFPADPSKVWHSWVLIEQVDGFAFPCDPTNSAVGLVEARRQQGKIVQGLTMPVSPLDWAMYLIEYYPTQAQYGKALKPSQVLLKLSYDEWRRLDCTVLRKSHGNLTGMTWFNTATVPDPPREHLGGN
jgi:hypothetical protein